MPFPEQERFTIKGVAERWGKSEQYVEALLEKQEFSYIIIHGERLGDRLNTRHVLFDRQFLKYLKADVRHIDPQEFSRQKRGNYINLGPYEYANVVDRTDQDWSLPEGCKVYIPIESIRAFEKKHRIDLEEPPNLLSAPRSQLVEPSVLSAGRLSQMSKNLQLAIAADEHFYGNKQLRSNQGHRAQIAMWLRKTDASLTESSIDHIVSVVNRSRGGAPKSR